MRKITSLKQYNELAKECCRGTNISNINCYFLPQGLSSAINEGRLAYLSTAAGLLLFWEKPLYTQLHLFMDITKPLEIERQEKPLVVHFIGANALSTKNRAVAQSLFNTGFERKASALRMTCIQSEDSTLAPFVSQLPKISLAQNIHAKAIMALWYDYFHPIENQLPTLAELTDALQAGEILCATDEKGCLLGALQMVFDKSTAWIWHEAVAPQLKGQGIGKALSFRFFAECRKRGITRHCLWVKEADESALRFHSAMGFSLDGKISEQFILQP